MSDLEESGGERCGGINVEHNLNGREKNQFLRLTPRPPSQPPQADRFAKRDTEVSGSTSRSTDNASIANTPLR